MGKQHKAIIIGRRSLVSGFAGSLWSLAKDRERERERERVGQNRKYKLPPLLLLLLFVCMCVAISERERGRPKSGGHNEIREEDLPLYLTKGQLWLSPSLSGGALRRSI